MWFLAIGLVLFVWQWIKVGPIYEWTWEQLGWISIPFILAVVWWSWADWSGYTKRKAMEREEAKRQARIERQRNQLRGGPRR